MSTLYISKSPSLSSLEAYVAELSGDQDWGVVQTLKAKCRYYESVISIVVIGSNSRELARAENSLLVAPTTESQNAKFGPRVTLKKTVWIVIKVEFLPLNRGIQLFLL
jgi:hypothetical protein